jgi:peptide/nickel transport system substrate-binding protein
MSRQSKVVREDELTIRATLGTGLLVAASAFAYEAAAGDLAVGFAAIATSADPHFHRAGYNFDLRENISDALAFASGVTGELEPRLAKSWEIVNDTTWHVTLEGNAKFDNGNALGADDVIYSLCRVRNVPESPGLYSSFVSTIASLADLGDGKLEITTKAPDPNLMRGLSNIGVYRDDDGTALELHQCVGGVIGSGVVRPTALVDPRREGRYLLAIECDGATYHSARSARDRDRLGPGDRRARPSRA